MREDEGIDVTILTDRYEFMTNKNKSVNGKHVLILFDVEGDPYRLVLESNNIDNSYFIDKYGNNINIEEFQLNEVLDENQRLDFIKIYAGNGSTPLFPFKGNKTLENLLNLIKLTLNEVTLLKDEASFYFNNKVINIYINRELSYDLLL